MPKLKVVARRFSAPDVESNVCGITEQHKDLAAQLSRILGRVTLVRESSGVHAYMASPICLDQDGARELQKRHLAVNLDKYLGNEKGSDLCGCCMKTSKAYRMSYLLRYCPSISERKIINLGPRDVKVRDNSRNLEDDGKGHMVPKGPGVTVAAFLLPEGHPARVYLSERGYDPLALFKQFRLSWCTKELEDGEYRAMKGGFRATPQNRLIFYIYQNGVRMGWQARILDAKRDNFWYYYHPYTSLWTPALERVGDGWKELLPPLEHKWDPVKYAIGAGASRNKLLMGYDSAVKFADTQNERYCFLTEGPFDAYSLGLGGMATMGKYLSDEQAKLVADNFTRCIYVGQNDKVSQEQGIPRVVTAFANFPQVQLEIPPLPSEFKDIGEMSREQAGQFREDCLKGKYEIGK